MSSAYGWPGDIADEAALRELIARNRRWSRHRESAAEDGPKAEGTQHAWRTASTFAIRPRTEPRARNRMGVRRGQRSTPSSASVLYTGLPTICQRC